MNKSIGVSSSEPERDPLALHIRSLRQWHGEHSISQADLALLAGISTRVLKRYEAARELPRALECLVAVAIALQVAPEQLIDPRRLAKMTSAIEQRRRARDGAVGNV